MMAGRWGRIDERLLTQNEGAERDGSPDTRGLAPGETGSWHCRSARRLLRGPELIDPVGAGWSDSGGFSPRATIAPGSQPDRTAEAEMAARARLRALPMVSILILAMATFWRCALHGGGVVHPYLDTTILVALGGVIALLWSRWPVSPARPRRLVADARQLGPYRLRQQIGAGAMGKVYLAEHQFLKRPCALKLIRPDSVGDPKALARFEREVRVTATLSHPNTVEIYDYGRTSDGIWYYVMEYLPGLNLAELVERYGPLPPGRVVYLLRQVCQALREAHAAGLIHRDVKPSNIVAARRGGMDDVAKLLDFGLARPVEAPESDLSAEGQILGTPLFMSPEQAKGDRELDERSDIYSLGAVAYHLLTGRPPFDGPGGMAVLIAHARDPVVPPSLILPGIPEDLEHVVLRCLAKDAANRFADAESLERALGECACSGGWDQDHAARWWRDAGRIATTPTTVPEQTAPAGRQ
jgi:tRNA A-37 threonylcarbamoyl transferase component Bud32